MAARSGTASSAFGFTGGITDPVSSLTYLRARDYDAAIGQFTTRDPAVEGTQQPYAYTGNDPLGTTDPLGLCAFAGDNDGLCSGLDSIFAVTLPTLGTINDFPDCVDSYDVGTCLVMTLDPVYAVLDGYGSEYQDIEKGCSVGQVVGDAAEGIGGLVGTALVAEGGVRGFRAGKSFLRSPWKSSPIEMGRLIEKKLEMNLPENYPTIDNFTGDGRATSIKSIDLTAKTYQSDSALYSRLKGYVDKVAKFQGSNYGGVEITPDEIATR